MITDTDKNILLQQYEDRGILKKEIRSYEVSLWTLQDDFITVLKWSDVEQKGRIENPKMTLNIDGTEKFTFSIPMYVRVMDYVKNEETGEMEYQQVYRENPSWYSVSQGYLVQGLNKVKVIFNKGQTEEVVYEMIITNVKESHEKDIRTCEVETEGLAFQELGKIGYKLNLSQENFELIYQQWQELGYWFDRTTIRSVDATKHIRVSSLPSSNIKGGYLYLVPEEQNKLSAYMYINNAWEKVGSANTYEPAQTLDYWCQEGCGIYPLTGANAGTSSMTWYYTVQLNHFSYEDGSLRESGKIYEESYPTAWDSSMHPTAIESYREKARPMTIENSNIYNITQDLAKTFGVFCRYEYGHDENYHINSRTIVFYNNFMQEDLGTLSIVYPYSAARTERQIDSTSVTTKLYVLSMDNDAILSGESTIMDAEPNYSGEDYILDFDYMKEIGAAPEDVDEKVQAYLQDMHDYNLDLKIAQRELVIFEDEKIKVEAKKTIAENSIKLDKETILQNQKFINAISAKDSDPNDGLFAREGANCDQGIIQVDESNQQYINLTTTYKGIVEDTVKIYKTYSSGEFSDPIQGFWFEHDDYNNVTRIRFSSVVEATNNRVYLEYKYDPKLYYQRIIETWEIKQNKDESNLCDYLRNLGPESPNDDKYELNIAYPDNEKTLEEAYNSGINKLINDRKNSIENTMRQKKEAIAKFEHYMGPNIREGYWQPEDYHDYGERRNYSNTLPDTTSASVFHDHFNNKQEITYIWDGVLFDDEDELYYEIGATQNREIYPCIDLYTLYGNNIPTDLNEYSVVWKASAVGTPSWNKIKDLGIMAVGSQALIRFAALMNSGTTTIHPILVLVGAKTFSPDELQKLILDGDARLEKYSITNVDGTMTATHTDYISLTNAWLCYRTFNTKPEGWSDRLYNKYQVSLDPVGKIRVVYPRINCSSLLLKTDSTNLVIKYDNQVLESIEDYYINTKYITRFLSTGYLEYFITLKPETLIKCGYLLNKEVSIYYVLSNANTEIYLDALKISKENAKPKVSYSVSIGALSTDLMHDLYRHLAHIVQISDSDLKFENVFGYISNLDLDLDKPWEDQIEIKNYTSKFEDLFSSIVAQVEEMRKNDGMMSAMLAGTSPLGESGLEKTIYMNDLILSAYLDSYFDSSEVVKQKLANLFDEASKILASSQKSLNEIASLSEENAGILQGFVQNVTAELTPEVFKQSTRPNEFKVGDIWIQIDNNGEEIARYIATANSSDLNPSSSPTAGFVRTSDGSLAQIKGAKIDIDSEAGKIDIEAETELNLKAGAEGSVNIAAGLDVNITGERSVNIGGTTINIGSTTINNTTVTGGINLVAAAYNASNFTGINASKVLISPTRIEMGAAELTMKSSSTINMIASQGTAANTSAIKLDANSGIWIGSGKSISLFSGTTTTGSNVQLTPTRIIMGVSNDSSSSVFELKPAYLLMAVGTTGSDFSSSNVNINSSNSITGMKLTKNSFGLAIGSGNNRTAIIANSSGITVGMGDTPVTSGSYVSITGSGVEIGSLGNLYINMNNFKLQTNNGLGTRFAVGYNLQYITQDSTVSGLIANSAPTMGNNTWIGLVFTNNSLYVNGNIYATTLNAVGGTSYFSVESSKMGFYKVSDNSAILTIDSNGKIQANGELHISADNLFIGSNSYKSEDVIETVKVYRSYTSDSLTSSNLPADGSTTADTNWTINIPELNSNTNYLYSCTRTKTRDLKYYYSNFKNESGYRTTAWQQAYKISTGDIAVPHVDSTGIEISGNSLNVKSTGSLLVAANGSVSIANSSSNSAILLNQYGITIASGADLNVATNNLILKSSPTNNSSTILELKYQVTNSNSYITGLTFSSTTGLTINGAVTATSFTAQSNKGYLKADDNDLGFYDNNNNAILTISTENNDSILTSTKAFKLSSGTTEMKLSNSQMIFNVNSIEALRLDATDGATIPKGTYGEWSITKEYGLRSYNTNNTNSYIGFTTINHGAGARSFWIDMPPNTTNNSTNNVMPAFYYKDGKVYIKHLVLWDEIEYDDGSSFNESNPGTGGGTSSGGGGGGGETNTVTYGNPNDWTHEIFINGASAGRESHEEAYFYGYICGKCLAQGRPTG